MPDRYQGVVQRLQSEARPDRVSFTHAERPTLAKQEPQRHHVSVGWIPDFGDRLIRGAPRRRLADPGAEIEGAPANRADASKRNLSGARSMFVKRSDQTSADGLRARQLAKEPARFLGRKAADGPLSGFN
jgi:hypothetical protein